MILLHLSKVKHSNKVHFNFEFRWLTAEIIMNTVKMGNFSEYFTSIDKLALSENIGRMGPHASSPLSPVLLLQPCQSQG